MKKQHSFIISGIILVVLALFFGYTYYDDHAWGAWGDDSPGYIFLAGRMVAGEPLVYTDELAAAGLEHFGDEKLARWLTPTHHQFINTQGTIASKYPTGSSLLLRAGAAITGDTKGFYLVTPFLAVLNLLLVYILAQLIFAQHTYRHVIGLPASFFLGISSLYYDYAIAQPMRDIPSMTFIVLMAILLIIGVRWMRQDRPRWQPLIAVALSGAAFGMAFMIRETSGIVLPAAFVYAVTALWHKGGVTKNLKLLWPYALAFLVAAVITLIPLIQNNAAISSEKEVFKARDTGSVVVLSNIGHIDSLSVENVFGNEGKFRPGKGALPHYWEIMQKSTPIPFFLVLVALGIVGMWKWSRPLTSLLILWAAGVLGLFSLWINPYSRYILPMFPALLLLGTYGLFVFFRDFLPKAMPTKRLRAVTMVLMWVAIVVAFIQPLTDLRENLRTDVYRFKAIAESDLDTLVQLADTLDNAQKPVLMFSGDWQYGTSETMQAHTGLKTIRFPYDQRFTFNTEQTEAFFDRMLADEYDLYVWQDTTSSERFFQWIEQFDRELIQTNALTFEPDARVYKIIKRR